MRWFNFISLATEKKKGFIFPSQLLFGFESRIAFIDGFDVVWHGFCHYPKSLKIKPCSYHKSILISFKRLKQILNDHTIRIGKILPDTIFLEITFFFRSG